MPTTGSHIAPNMILKSCQHNAVARYIGCKHLFVAERSFHVSGSCHRVRTGNTACDRAELVGADSIPKHGEYGCKRLERTTDG